ncbi:MAG: RNA polymerase sigma factor [Acidimicrobiales bacterium]
MSEIDRTELPSSSAALEGTEAPLVPDRGGALPDLTPDPLLGGWSGAAVQAEFKRLARLAFLLRGDQARADDDAAEAIARVWQRLQRSGIEDVRPYLNRTLVNIVSKSRRRHASEQKTIARLGQRETGDAPELDDTVATRTDVGRALQALPLEQRSVIVLRYFAGLSEAEIAETLRIRPGTVKSRASRALRDLQLTLKGDHDD